MKERIATWFPFVLAALVPLAGVVLALAWAADGRRREAGNLVGAAVLGAVVWILVLTA